MTSELKVGHLIDGRYEVIAELGAGMSASVYSARDTQLDRTVAVKVLRQHTAVAWTDDRKERFFREAQALSQLQSPSVIQVHRIGLLADGSPFIVRQLAEGRTLGSVLAQEKTLTSAQAANICAQIADALAVAHRSGILHRDVKPDNIIISEEEGKAVARLVDFGLSTFSAEGQQEIMRLTMTGEIVGTPAYMSPEQARGEKLDARCDIYALGCVLFACLTGNPPFASDDPMEVLWSHLNRPVPDLRSLYPDRSIPEPLVSTIKQVLAKSADKRYQTAEELAHDLREIERLQAVKLPTVVKSDPKAKAKRRRQILQCALFALTIGAIVSACWIGQTIISNDNAGIQAVQLVSSQGSKKQAQDLGVWIVLQKRRQQGPAHAAEFAVQVVSCAAATGGLPENEIPFVFRCLQAIGPTEARNVFPLELLLVQRAFYNVKGVGTLDRDLATAALNTATLALLPPPTLLDDQRGNYLSAAQWDALDRVLERHYDIERDFVSNGPQPHIFSRLKELNALAQLYRAPVNADSANMAAKYYEQASQPYLHDMDADAEFDRLINAGMRAAMLFDNPNKRALLWRSQSWRLYYKGKKDEARKLFDQADAVPAFYWAYSGQESADHGHLRQLLYGDGAAHSKAK